MNIAIIGASGFLGKNLTYYLLENTNYNIKALAPDIENLKIKDDYKSRINLIKIDGFDLESTKRALEKVDIAFYFIHLLCQKTNFYQKEIQIAETVGKALYEAKVKKVVYMSGLGNDRENLSLHLFSRHKTGQTLRKYVNQIIEFRGSMIIGKGSASFEIVKDIIHKSPIVLLPKNSINRTQPIRLEDVLLYLNSAISLPNKENLIIEIGGPEVLSYQDFLKKYRNYAQKRTLIIRIPFLPPRIAGFFLNFFTSKRQATIGQNMITSFKNEMIVTNNNAKIIFPEINPQKIELSFS